MSEPFPFGGNSDCLRQTSAGNLKKPHRETGSSLREGSVESDEPLSETNYFGPAGATHQRQTADIRSRTTYYARGIISVIFVVLAFTFLFLIADAPFPFLDDSHPRPYVISSFWMRGFQIGNQVYRFPVTGPASDHAFTLISMTAPASDALGVLPHIHKSHYENFFCLSGSLIFWAQRDVEKGEQQARVMNAGDYIGVPHNTSHTFQFTDPLTAMIGTVVPGGFEELFYFLGQSSVQPFRKSIYLLSPQGTSGLPEGNPEITARLTDFDVHPRLDFQPRRDYSDSSAPAEKVFWHDGFDQLAEDSHTASFIAKDRGPKYLTSSSGFDIIIQPFVLPHQFSGNFTQGTMSYSRLPNVQTAKERSLPGHMAIEVIGGNLIISMKDENVMMTRGSTAFIPGKSRFSIWSESTFSKFMYICQGSSGLDQELLRSAVEWNGASFPEYAPE